MRRRTLRGMFGDILSPSVSVALLYAANNTTAADCVQISHDCTLLKVLTAHVFVTQICETILLTVHKVKLIILVYFYFELIYIYYLNFSQFPINGIKKFSKMVIYDLRFFSTGKKVSFICQTNV